MKTLSWGKRFAFPIVVLAALAALCVPATATLHLLQPDGAVPATFVGRGGVSTDGLGQSGGGGTIQADVPAGSTVVQAYLYATYSRATTTRPRPTAPSRWTASTTCWPCSARTPRPTSPPRAVT